MFETVPYLVVQVHRIESQSSRVHPVCESIGPVNDVLMVEGTLVVFYY